MLLFLLHERVCLRFFTHLWVWIFMLLLDRLFQFEFEMFPTGTCVWTLQLQMMVLFGEFLESLVGVNLLEEAPHCGWALENHSLVFLFSASCVQLLCDHPAPCSCCHAFPASPICLPCLPLHHGSLSIWNCDPKINSSLSYILSEYFTIAMTGELIPMYFYF